MNIKDRIRENIMPAYVLIIMLSSGLGVNHDSGLTTIGFETYMRCLEARAEIKKIDGITVMGECIRTAR